MTVASTTALRAQRANIWEQMKALTNLAEAADRDFTAEEKASYEKMEADLDSIGARVERLEKESALDAKLDKIVDMPGGVIDAQPKDKSSDDEYAEAFIKERISLHEAAKKSLPYCTAEEQWRKADVWAVHSEGRKSAHRLLDSEEAANTYAETVNGGFVVHRPGEAVRCEKYCSVNTFCTQYEVMVK